MAVLPEDGSGTDWAIALRNMLGVVGLVSVRESDQVA